MCAIGAGLLVAAAGAASGQLMVVESSNDQVMLLSEEDGSLIDPNFIDLTPVGARTPINAIVVGDEIWVSDQVEDKISRWSLDGEEHLGDIIGGMDNIRGIEYVAATETVYVSNSGTGNGAPGQSVIMIDATTGSIDGHFLVGPAGDGDPFDVHLWDGQLLANDIDAENLELHDVDGTWLSTFHDSDGLTGIDFPEQMSSTTRNTVLAGGFSSPAGVYEYDENGNQINYWEASGVRGVHELDNGDILFTNGSGVHVLDPGTGSVTTVVSGVSGRFIERMDEPGDLCFFQTGCPADVDGNNVADVGDFFAFLDLFSSQDPCADVDESGSVDVADFFLYLDLFSTGC